MVSPSLARGESEGSLCVCLSCVSSQPSLCRVPRPPERFVRTEPPRTYRASEPSFLSEHGTRALTPRTLHSRRIACLGDPWLHRYEYCIRYVLSVVRVVSVAGWTEHALEPPFRPALGATAWRMGGGCLWPKWLPSSMDRWAVTYHASAGL